MTELTVAELRAQLDRHVAYLAELGERALAFATPGWDYDRGRWMDLHHPDGHTVLVP